MPDDLDSVHLKRDHDHPEDYADQKAEVSNKGAFVAPRSQVEDSEAYIADLKMRLLENKQVSEMIKQIGAQVSKDPYIDMKTFLREQTNAFLVAEGFVLNEVIKPAPKKVKRSLLDFV
jgi:hypothetical protein